MNIAVESELYTRFDEDGQKDTAIEEWFAKEIDGPSTRIIEHFLDPDNTRRRPFRGDPAKAKTTRELGFRVNDYFEEIVLPQEIRTLTARYLAALLVRHPQYLGKLQRFHAQADSDTRLVRERALANMLTIYETYTNAISRAELMITKRVGTNEYIYADGGLSIQEPWLTESGIPFDIHAPLTPDIAIQVFPIPHIDTLHRALVGESTNQGVSRQNRIMLGIARRFVFTRQAPPTGFIAANFGKPAPKNIGRHMVNGRVQVTYDPTRE
ncbi:hypothetical protein A1355_16620 [Methylomonas koyamae]|uniref:Uncharacterized protein n=1 Tax=Methylomonas koyamae TaxID=702114 RepID=A0A177PIH7_9GAMM|nr:hypothetical protein A1355_16620 [Methylomonas koyamae]